MNSTGFKKISFIYNGEINLFVKKSLTSYTWGDLIVYQGEPYK